MDRLETRHERYDRKPELNATARVCEDDDVVHPGTRIEAQRYRRIEDGEHVVSFHVYNGGKHVGEPIWATAETVHAFAKQLVEVAHEVDAHNIADDVARRAVQLARDV